MKISRIFNDIRISILVLGLSIGAPVLGQMGGGMMSGGMMGSQDNSKDESPKSVNAENANKLVSYIKDEQLRCMQCHSVSKQMFGPTFADIAVRNKNQKDAISKLRNHITHGVGRMPAGYANDKQALVIARKILGLTEGSGKAEKH